MWMNGRYLATALCSDSPTDDQPFRCVARIDRAYGLIPVGPCEGPNSVAAVRALAAELDAYLDHATKVGLNNEPLREWAKCVDENGSTLPVLMAITEAEAHMPIPVVINVEYGVFSLSEEAVVFLAERGHHLALAQHMGSDAPAAYSDEIERDDPDLVACVRALGDRAAGPMSRLAVVEIPWDAGEWEIAQYDGLEWIVETHRRWGPEGELPGETPYTYPPVRMR